MSLPIPPTCTHLNLRSEIQLTINWIRTHLEEDPQISLPKHEVLHLHLLLLLHLLLHLLLLLHLHLHLPLHQAEAIPLILGGGDVLMAAETGSGKTGAFCLPVLQVGTLAPGTWYLGTGT